jgi:hypothetical protein
VPYCLLVKDWKIKLYAVIIRIAGRTQTEVGNRVLRRIFGLKREEEAGGCRRLHHEELHNLSHKFLLG